MKALVTGSSGFLGQRLCATLQLEKHSSFGVDAKHGLYTDMARDLLAPSGREPSVLGYGYDCDVCFHLAAKAGVTQSFQDPEGYVRANVEGTARLVEMLVGEGVPRLVLASTSSVYGDAMWPSCEGDPLLPQSPYARSKIAAEQVALAHGHEIEVVIVRYFTVYGPRQREDMAFQRWCRAAMVGQPLLVRGDGTMTRSFTHVDDAVRGTLLAAQKGRPGETYNIGHPEPRSLNDVIAGMEADLGRELEREYVPALRGDVPATHCGHKKSEDELGFLATIGVREGVRSQLRSFGWDG